MYDVRGIFFLARNGKGKCRENMSTFSPQQETNRKPGNCG